MSAERGLAHLLSHKRCTKCGREKPRGEFGERSSAKDGKHPHCKACVKLYNASWHAVNAEKARNDNARWRAENPDYGKAYRADHAEEERERRARWRSANPERAREQAKQWAAGNPESRQRTKARYNRSTLYGLADSVGLELRDRPCDICGRAQGSSEKAHHIDHCHETGAVRGILCSQCNTALGKFQDSPELLARAIHYLTRGADYRAVDREA
jgi:hypothetical protein